MKHGKAPTKAQKIMLRSYRFDLADRKSYEHRDGYTALIYRHSKNNTKMEVTV